VGACFLSLKKPVSWGVKTDLGCPVVRAFCDGYSMLWEQSVRGEEQGATAYFTGWTCCHYCEPATLG
jgi:hypothetical protein